MKRVLLILLSIIGLTGCNNDQELTEIDGFPDEIDGCSCYFSQDKGDFDQKKFVYLDTYYQGTAFISVNGQLIKIDLDNPDQNDYKVEIQFDTDEQNGDEVWWKTGTMTVMTKEGRTLTTKFVGECGC